MQFPRVKGLSIKGLNAQGTKVSEQRVTWAENLAASEPLAILAGPPAADVPPAAVGVPVDMHGEDFTVFALDVEDVRVVIVHEEPRLAFQLSFDETRDVLEGREVLLRQFLADVLVVGVRLEEQGHVGTFGSRRDGLAVFDVEPFAEQVTDVKAEPVLEELGGIEGIGPCFRSGRGDGFEELGFNEHRIARAELPQGIDGCLFDENLEPVATRDDQLSTVLVEKVRLSHCRFGSTFGGVCDETHELLLLS